MIINPILANTLNAVMCGLMSFGLLMTPQKFMQGGAYQAPWFKDLPEERDNKLYYVGQFMAFVMLGGCVVPTIMYPSSQFLCYQMAAVHSVSIVHTLIFMCSSAYKKARPTETSTSCYWTLLTRCQQRGNRDGAAVEQTCFHPEKYMFFTTIDLTTSKV